MLIDATPLQVQDEPIRTPQFNHSSIFFFRWQIPCRRERKWDAHDLCNHELDSSHEIRRSFSPDLNYMAPIQEEDPVLWLCEWRCTYTDVALDRGKYGPMVRVFRTFKVPTGVRNSAVDGSYRWSHKVYHTPPIGQPSCCRFGGRRRPGSLSNGELEGELGDKAYNPIPSWQTISSRRSGIRFRHQSEVRSLFNTLQPPNCGIR